ncbi:DUF5691 domain-containing protein [Plectonema radiosum NIES-515]|uniref:DUF5691 domain-containing protein n=1 Tax=Plectonema radiosum NIES-515 TaxID=2986073 RepID=A0ABT3B0I4_9CYAN|nr:DUF5691 domain-containing protein [Plectonema radiosum]MCV3214374.1 DUF5691 domain-containing protein [Plectonema radiosum NIES-515]
MKHLWQEVVKTALIGTERQGLKAILPDNKLSEILSCLDSSDKEGNLLSAAGAFALYQRAGKISFDQQPLQNRSEEEELLDCSLLSRQHLALILSGNAQLLPEWLTVAAAAKRRVPSQYLPQLLTLGQKQSNLRVFILPVLGKRGYWLAKQNPDWNYVNSEITDKAWQIGSKEARRSLLQRLREQNPEQAREKLQKTWKKESGDERASLLAALEINLSMNDEPFLEAALDDKRKQVRDIAAKLLSLLPKSRLCQRMIERVHPLIIFNHNSVQVSLPVLCDRQMIRDGIDQSRYSSALGEKASLLLQMLCCVPPSFWCNNWGKMPQQLLQVVDGNEWEKMLLEAWATGALKSQDSLCAEVLLPNASKFYHSYLGNGEELVVGLLKLLGQNKADALILQILLENQGKLLSVNHPAYTLLKHYQMPWSEKVSQLVLLSVGKYIEADKHCQWGMRSLFQRFALYMEPSVMEAAGELLAVVEEGSFWQGFVNEFLAMLLFRFEMIQELRGE